MFSAYDIKKILPRAVLALVAINLSWSLMTIMINSIGALGEITQELITAPFSLGVQSNINNNAAGGLAAFAALGAAAGVGLGLIPIAGVAVAGLFGILFAFGIAMLRRVCLIGLVVIAPVAIALSVLPQTEKWAKQWWEWFSKLLLMYPFIMAFFGLSEVAAHLVSSTSAAGSTLGSVQEVIYTLAGAAILIMPYFVVGKAFSLAGGAIGKVAGMVNNKDKGLIDKTKKWDAQRVANNKADSKAGSRYQDRLGTRTINRALGLGFNRGSSSRAQDAFSQRMATLKDSHPGIESLTGEEARLLAESQGSERKMKDAIEDMAQELQRTGKAGDITQARVMAKAMATSAERKAGGVNAVTAAYALQKAVESGSITDGRSIERLGHGIGETALGASQGGAFGAQLASGAKGAAIKKQQETLNMQTQAINAAEEAGNFELADKLRTEAGYKFSRDASGRVTMSVGDKGTAANLKALGLSLKPGANEQDLGARTADDYHTAGRSRKRMDDPSGASTPAATPPPSPSPTPPPSPPPPSAPTWSVGDKVKSTERKVPGVVTGIASDGNPIVTYEVDGAPEAYTKAENLESR